MVNRECSPAYYSRVTTDEPWRYICPKCKSHTVVLTRKEPKLDVDKGTFYCQGCRNYLDGIWDKKDNKHRGDIDNAN